MFEGFETLDFPTPENISSLGGCLGGYVYVIVWALPDGPEIPFYVGQTMRLSGRMWDYCAAEFQAGTDFRVGEAIRYLRGEKGCRIKLLYKASNNPRKDEHDLIRELQVSGPRLINGLAAYDYRTSELAEERHLIQRFCDLLVSTFSR